MRRAPRLHPRSFTAQAMGWTDRETRAISPPIHMSTTFERAGDGSYPAGHVYLRSGSPANTQAEALLAALEKGEDALVFGSGMAAATAVFQALAPGDHVLAPRIMYWALRQWLDSFARGWGLDVELVAMDDLAAVERALRPGRSRLVWIETPANPLWTITDVAAVVDLAHAAGARVAVDSTVATPVLTRPLELGADLVMHAATKYLNGHSDVLAGALVTARKDELWERVRAVRTGVGGVLGPMEAWLLVRGLRTLHLRVEASCRAAERIAVYLAGHPAVVEVLYPGLPSAAGHAVAARQMSGGFGGMLSLRVAGGERAAMATAAAAELWKRATSLGGVESLIEHRASIEGAGSPVPSDLLRLSVGIEHPDDLIEDLARALAAGQTT